MKKYIFKCLLSFVLISAIFISCFSISVFATDMATENKMDSMLIDALNAATDDEMIPVSIWFKDINKSELAANTVEDIDALIDDERLPLEATNTIDLNTALIDTADLELTIQEIQELIVAERENAQLIYSEYNTEMIENITASEIYCDVIYLGSFAPNIVVSVKKSDVYDLASFDSVECLYYYEEELLDDSLDSNTYSTVAGNSELTFDDCLDAIGAYDSLTGDGVKIGSIDSWLPSRVRKPLKNKEDVLITDPSAPIGTDNHPSITASQLIGSYSDDATNFVGMVPEATLYCTSYSDTYSWKAGLEWLISNGVNVINISNSLTNYRYTTINDVSKWIDHVSNQHNVTVVVASGYLQELDTDEANGMLNISPLAYSKNAIVVGAIDLGVDSNGSYVFSKYSGDIESAYSSSGLYFPHVVAPGNPFAIPGLTGNTSASQETGNSFSAPFVVGSIAELIEAHPGIATNPTLIKSLVMAGANGEKSRTSIDTSGTDMDREYGAGVVNVSRTRSCISSSYAKYYTGYFSSGSMTSKELIVNINRSGNVRMALNWQANVCFANGDNHSTSSNLDYNTNSYLKLTVTSPDGRVFTSFDVLDTFQLLSFDVPSDDLGTYSVTISRHGPSGHVTPIALAIYGGDYVTY